MSYEATTGNGFCLYVDDHGHYTAGRKRFKVVEDIDFLHRHCRDGEALNYYIKHEVLSVDGYKEQTIWKSGWSDWEELQ